MCIISIIKAEDEFCPLPPKPSTHRSTTGEHTVKTPLLLQVFKCIWIWRGKGENGLAMGVKDSRTNPIP